VDVEPLALSVARRRFLIGAGALTGSVLVTGLVGCSSGDDGASGTDDPTTEAPATDGPAARDPRSAGPSTTEPKAEPLVEAFFAGVPLVVTMRTMQTFSALVGVNNLFPTKALADTGSRYVVAPNHDTLYAIAVLDLDAGPQVLTLPDIEDRYHVLQILDAWMGGIALLGSRATGGRAGVWVIAREGADPDIPKGAILLESPTRHAFILGRVRATEADVDEAAKVAASITLAPLVTPDRGSGGPLMLPAPVGPPQDVGTNGAGFFDELGDLLVMDEPVTRSQTAALAAVSDLVGPELHPTTAHPDQVPELQRAVVEGLAALDASLKGATELVNGWELNVNLGTAADELSLRQRAVIARSFWGPVPAEEAVYLRAVEATNGKPLSGDMQYRIRLDGDDLPPVDGFWSFTVYGQDLYFVANEIDRYSLSGETPGLVTAKDGSIDIVLAHQRPRQPRANWLPTPAGPFTLIMRLYLPQQPILNGTWDYPLIEAIGS
jgi:hypothetical protein